jgi:hypothetical protein
MTPARRLRAVPKEPPEPPVDITLAMRADIVKRDWAAVHVAGDRARPIWLPANWKAPR